MFRVATIESFAHVHGGHYSGFGVFQCGHYFGFGLCLVVWSLFRVATIQGLALVQWPLFRV